LRTFPALVPHVTALSQAPAAPRRPAFSHGRDFSATGRARHALTSPAEKIFANNREWVAKQLKTNPGFLTNLSAPQEPEYLWIGCSDSRIPVEQIAGLGPGEVFVHRNIANLVMANDLSATSVIQYAVEHLKVKHIIVKGHYGCGGVLAAMGNQDMGMLNPWLTNIRLVYRLHHEELDAIADADQRYRRLVELNVMEQCRNVMATAVVQQAYAKQGFPKVHGWVFDMETGLLKDLEFNFERAMKDVKKTYDVTGSS
jgi:carbonic anhydrase